MRLGSRVSFTNLTSRHFASGTRPDFALAAWKVRIGSTDVFGRCSREGRSWRRPRSGTNRNARLEPVLMHSTNPRRAPATCALPPFGTTRLILTIGRARCWDMALGADFCRQELQSRRAPEVLGAGSIGDEHGEPLLGDMARSVNRLAASRRDTGRRIATHDRQVKPSSDVDADRQQHHDRQAQISAREDKTAFYGHVFRQASIAQGGPQRGSE